LDEGLTTPHIKIIKLLKVTQTLELGRVLRYDLRDMTSGTRSMRRLYRPGTMKRVAKELAKYDLG